MNTILITESPKKRSVSPEPVRKPSNSSKRRKPSPKRSPSPVRKPERSSSRNSKRKTPTRIARPRTPPKPQTSDEDYTDNEVILTIYYVSMTK